MLVSRPSAGSFVKFLIPALFIFLTTYYLFSSGEPISLPGYVFSDDSTPKNQDALGPPGSPKPPVVTKEQLKQEFIQDVLDHEIDGPMNLAPLTELCSNTKWQPGLIAKCQALPGGIGNIRNMFLNCVRFAIEAGATGLMIPEVRYRNKKDLSDIHTSNLYPFSYVIDTDFFVESFSKACPQVTLYSNQTALPMTVTPETQFNLTCYELAPKLQWHTLIDMPPPEWRKAFDGWIRHESRAPDFSADKPAFFYILNNLLRWPFIYDSNDFVAQFGRILRPREDTRRIAGAVLWSMSEIYKLNLDYSSPTGQLPEGKFMGAHLRTAADATKVGWPGYDSQETNYMHAANVSNLDLIYLTTGAPDDAKRFTKTAKNNGITVTSKELLLKGSDFKQERKILESLTWDQRALVDLEVLFRCSYFVGMFESSFSWNVAMRRHVVTGNGTWLTIEPGKQGLDGLVDPAEAFMDKYSAVYGPVDLGIRWQFPMALFP